jgi:hypothetical protein
VTSTLERNRNTLFLRIKVADISSESTPVCYFGSPCGMFRQKQRPFCVTFFSAAGMILRINGAGIAKLKRLH